MLSALGLSSCFPKSVCLSVCLLSGIYYLNCLVQFCSFGTKREVVGKSNCPGLLLKVVYRLGVSDGSGLIAHFQLLHESAVNGDALL